MKTRTLTAAQIANEMQSNPKWDSPAEFNRYVTHINGNRTAPDDAPCLVEDVRVEFGVFPASERPL